MLRHYTDLIGGSIALGEHDLQQVIASALARGLTQEELKMLNRLRAPMHKRPQCQAPFRVLEHLYEHFDSLISGRQAIGHHDLQKLRDLLRASVTDRFCPEANMSMLDHFRQVLQDPANLGGHDLAVMLKLEPSLGDIVKRCRQCPLHFIGDIARRGHILEELAKPAHERTHDQSSMAGVPNKT